MSSAPRRRKNKRKPLYQQVEDRLGRMLQGMPAGTYLPSEPSLAKRFGVSRATLREAMRPFEERGVIVRKQGVGTYVNQPPLVIETGLEVLESVETLAGRMGLAISMADLSLEQRPATDREQERFGLAGEAPVLQISRLLLTAGQPVTYLVDIVPAGLIEEQELGDSFRGSVLDLFLRRGTPALSHSRTEIRAVPAPAHVARRLGLEGKQTLLLLEAWLCTLDGQVVDHSLSYFLPGTFRFHVVRRVGRSSVAGEM